MARQPSGLDNSEAGFDSPMLHHGSIIMMYESFMFRCLELAERGRGNTGINPMVGAVLVRNGKIIAEGFHSEFGKPHAERQLLENTEPTNQSARSARFGALREICSTDVLYVNMEPCCHIDKKTPPCAQFLIERGVKHLVFGMRDPNPEVSGKGIAYLRSQGVEVIGPILEDECLRFNRGFVSLQTAGRPWITLKMARTRDGRIPNQDGSPLKITSAEQDAWSHRFLRARHDAILVGVNTIIIDDPRLTVRCSSATSPHPQPLPPAPAGAAGGGVQGWGHRIILDPHLRIPIDAKVVTPPLADGTIILRKEIEETEESDETEETLKILEERGVRIMTVPYRKNVFDWEALWQALITPDGDFHGITSILVEGGPKTWKIFRDAGIVDEEVVLIGT